MTEKARPNDVLIRAFEPGDIPAVTEVMNQPRAYWGTLQVPFTSVESRRRKQESAHPDLHLVSVVEEQVVGSAALMRFQDRRGHAATFGMAVHDAFAGRGCGRALLAALTETADNWLNIKRIELNVWSDNARAIALYASFGFEKEGVLRAYAWREGAYADALMMARMKGL